MELFGRLLAALFAALTGKICTRNKIQVLYSYFAVLQPCLGQDSTPTVYTDPDTGIVFDTWTASNEVTNGGLTLGLAFPSDALTTDASEFIGYLVRN